MGKANIIIINIFGARERFERVNELFTIQFVCRNQTIYV